jgi:L-methionine (R)-S-oxide reductase
MLPTPLSVTDASSPERNAALLAALEGLLAGERDAIANMANTAALLFGMLPELNWAGFYRWSGPWPQGELVVGPFQGKPACVRIAPGRGVCGTAAVRRQTLLVPDVHAFDGHIACDSASRSELVVPLLREARVLGVLDLDSPRPARFDAGDALLLEEVVRRLVAGCDWPA